MVTLTKSRLKRLRECEECLLLGIEDWFRQGMALKEIKDDELYREDEHESFAAYLRARPQFGYSERAAQRKIMAAEIRKTLPMRTTGAPTWGLRVIEQLNRLPTTAKARQIAGRLLKEVESDGRPITSTMARKAVDKIVGRKRRRKKQPPTLAQFLREWTVRCENVAEAVEQVPNSVLKELAAEKPLTTKELASALDRLWKALERIWSHLPG